MECTALVAEVLQYHYHSCCLCYYRSPCCSSDAHIEHEDEYRVEYGIEHNCEYGQGHGLLRISGRTHGGVEAEVQVGHYVSVEDDLYVFLCVRKGVFAGTEEIEYRVNEYQGHGHEEQAKDDVQADYVSENLVCSLIILLTQKDRQHCRCSGSHKGTEGCGEVHERECDRKA